MNFDSEDNGDAGFPKTTIPHRKTELRVYGFHACQALAAKRPTDIRKVYLTAQRKRDFGSLLGYCAQQRIGFSVVAPEELEKLTESSHHEGICLVTPRPNFVSEEELLDSLPPQNVATTMFLLERVENPHNLGAIIRIAAHFGVFAVLLSHDSTVTLSGAVYRIAEGGMEAVRLVKLSENQTKTLSRIRNAKFQLIATEPEAKLSLSSAKLARRVMLLFGAEREGLSEPLARIAQLRVVIPGSGSVESLNVAAASAVLAWECARQNQPLTKAAPATSFKPQKTNKSATKSGKRVTRRPG